MSDSSDVLISFCHYRETKTLGKKEEQKGPENEAGEVRGTSRISSPASLRSLSPRPGVDEQSSTQCAMCVEEVGKCSCINK